MAGRAGRGEAKGEVILARRVRGEAPGQFFDREVEKVALATAGVAASRAIGGAVVVAERRTMSSDCNAMAPP